MPLISVIVPVYNVEKYLNRCVDSILNQTFTDFELILVDDESTDRCGLICDEYVEKDSRVKVIHKKNGGVSSARNAGIDEAIGKYVMFCDSDDYVKSDWIEQLYNGITYTNADMVSSNYVEVDDANNHLYVSKCTNMCTSINDDEEMVKFILFSFFKGKIGSSVLTKIFLLNKIRCNNIRFSSTCCNYAEDMGFTLEYILCSKKIHTIDYVGYYYYMRNSSMMHQSEHNIKFNEVNEISFCVHMRFCQNINQKKARKQYPIIHFMIMSAEYGKFLKTDWINSIKGELKKIKRREYFKKECKKLRYCYSELKLFYGNDFATRMVIFSEFCSNQNKIIYLFKNAVYYKLIKK